MVSLVVGPVYELKNEVKVAEDALKTKGTSRAIVLRQDLCNSRKAFEKDYDKYNVKWNCSTKESRRCERLGRKMLAKEKTLRRILQSSREYLGTEEALEALVAEATQAFMAAKQAFNKAQQDLTDAKDAVRKAEKDLEDAKNAQQRAQEAVGKAKKDLEDAKNAQQRAQEAVGKAKKDLADAKETQQTPQEAVGKAEKDLADAESAQKRAQEAVGKAKKDLEDAESAQKRAREAFENAERELSDAGKAQQTAQEAVKKAENGTVEDGTQDPALKRGPESDSDSGKPSDAGEEASTEETPSERELEDTKKELKKAENEIADLKAGKLIRYGVTGGVAPAFHLPLHGHRIARFPVGDVAALPYVLFHPAYWSATPEQNIYCANQWGGKDSVAAGIQAADKSAYERAEKLADTLIERARADDLGTSEDVLDTVCTSSPYCTNATEVQSLAIRAVESERHKKTKKFRDSREALIGHMQRDVVGWNPGIPGKCRVHKYVGLWVGYPVGKTTVTIPARIGDDSVMRIERDVTSIFAFGYGLSPNAYVSILFGISLGRVNLTSDNDKETVASFVVGIGGNLDLFTLFSK